jgi:diguanylate cyclase (GGDEF)-like protein/PAS domain S-box-containing protein
MMAGLGTSDAAQYTPKRESPSSMARSSRSRCGGRDSRSPALVGLLDLDGTIRYVNAPALQNAALKASEVIGKRLENISSLWTAGASPRRLRSAVRDAVAGCGSQFDFVIADGTGRPLTLHFSLEPVQCVNGKTAYFVFSVHDVTEQRRSERAAQVEVGHAQEAVVRVTADGEIRYVNDAACRLLGYERDELLTVRVFELDADMEPDKWHLWWLELKSRRTLQMQTLVRHKHGYKRIPVALLADYIEHEGWECASLHLIDIGERVAFGEYIRRSESYDLVTGLPNRAQLLNILEQRFREGDDSAAEVALLVVGLDRLALINDSLGRPGADQVLAEVARRLTRCAGEAVPIGRLTADEFAMAVATERPGAAHTAELADSILAALSPPIRVGGEDIYVTCGIGVATSRGGGETAEDLITNAGIALREVRRQAGGPTQLFTHRSRIRGRERLRLEADLHRAMERGEFVLFYQPRVDAQSGKIERLEALIRWPRPDGQWIAPGRFIPIAEETGLIHPIGAWALRSSVFQAKAWQNRVGSMTGISVNLSARQFRQPDLIHSIARLLEITGLHPHSLELELTETMLISDAEDAIRSMHALKNLGIRLSLDDFGTGYSSLSYLSRFPIDALKIDQVFVQKMEIDSASVAIVDTIISIAHRLGLSVTAEGVETEHQLGLLRERGCDELQGYLIAHPMPVARIEQLLDQQALSHER